jgi:hypothetical protein
VGEGERRRREHFEGKRAEQRNFIGPQRQGKRAEQRNFIGPQRQGKRAEQRNFIGPQRLKCRAQFFAIIFLWHDVDSNVKLKFLTPSIILVATWFGLLNMVPLYQIP